MRRPVYTKQFHKDIKRMQRAGNKDMEKLKRVVTALIEEEPLDKSYRDHPLKGPFKDRRECHLAPDRLLVYKLDKKEIVFERTGSHADLFE
ncbi:MAG TPA: type II toxin-antitoxin system YafQ family toxin [Syntrophorhabdaceae bacterium]|nr:type II toxin-antitoxin system YafQ family toxin [Syntrophorhabdaceae bacterium]